MQIKKRRPIIFRVVSARDSSHRVILRGAFNLTLLVAWIWLFWPVFQYLKVLFTGEEFRTNQIVLLLVTGLLIYQARKLHLRPDPAAAPHLYIPGLAMALGSSLAYLLVERYLDINTLSAFLFGLASYGLLGLWMSPSRWRRGFPAMLLAIGVLPFGEHLETFAGYPLRTFTAGLVRDALSNFGFHSVGVDTILVFESGISQVDIPCSGVKSLWTGAMFLLAATWIENHPLGLRWLGVALATAALLFITNLIRVGVLALTGPALGWTVVAQILHLPMGVLGFLGTCAAALTLLRHLPTWPKGDSASESNAGGLQSRRPTWLAPLVVICAVVMALAYAPRDGNNVVSAAAPPAWRFLDEIKLAPAPLSAKELEWIREGGAETADRFTFNWQGTANPSISGGQDVKGALMLLTSHTWRGQHPPERCFEVFGLTVNETVTVLVTPEFPLRYLTLSSPDSPAQVSAVYWLQSRQQTTEDFGQRIWADLGPQRERWVLVTVLFNQVVDPYSPEVASFLTALHASMERSLK